MNAHTHPARRRTLLTAAILPAVLLAAAPATAQAGTNNTLYYVNDGSLYGDRWCTAPGSDTHDGLSSNSPKATLQGIITNYHPGPGDTIFIEAGIYPLAADAELPDTGPGDPGGAWLEVIGVPGRTFFDRQAPAGESVGLRVRQDCTRIEGLAFRGAKTGLRIESDTCRNAEIARCLFTANSGYALQVPNDTGTGVSHYLIRNNLVFANGEGLNLQADAATGSGWFTVENNTVVTEGTIAISLGGAEGASTLRNNIIHVRNAGYCLFVRRANALLSCNYNNLLAEKGAWVAKWAAADVYQAAETLAAWRNATGFDSASLSRDPFFVAPLTQNYHLQSAGGSWHGSAWVADPLTSPCLDAGDPESAFGLEPVPNGGRVNLGAYGNTELASRSVSNRTLTILSPTGGAIWPQPVVIVWSASGEGWQTTDTVRIEFTTGTGTWFAVAGAGELPHTGTFTWTPPNPDATTAAYQLRVVCNGDSSIAAVAAGTVYRVPVSYFVNDTSTNGDRWCTAPGAYNNDGRAPDRPQSSIRTLLKSVTMGPGDTVFWDAGSYTQTLDAVIESRHAGAPDAPIRILGVPRATRLVREGDTNDRSCLNIEANHVQVEGLTCRKATGGITVNTLTARNVTLAGNVLEDNDFGINIKFSGNSSAVKGEYRILQNLITGGGTNASSSAGIYLYDGSTSGSTNNLSVFIVENNTVRTPYTCIRMWSLSTDRLRVQHYLKNNILETTGTNSNSICISARPGTINFSDYNLLYAPSGCAGAWKDGAQFVSIEEWRAASGQDLNSLAADPGFADLQHGDLHLRHDSPAVDAGVNSFWMFGGTDLDGCPRIAGPAVDLGACEYNLRAKVRVFLQGPWQTYDSAMRTTLRQDGYLPMTSPYAEDPRTAARLPAAAVDWILLQFRRTPGDPALFSRAAFLDRNGWIVDDAGVAGVGVNVPADTPCHVVVRHRNHLSAISALPVTANEDGVLACDFTTNAAVYLGGAEACVPVDATNGVRFALVAGDADGDGTVTALDGEVCTSQSAGSGYLRGNIDLDGFAATTDSTLIMNQQGRFSPVPKAETFLLPALRLSPSRLTVRAGEDVTLTGWNSADTAGGTVSNTPTDGVGTVVQPLADADTRHWGFTRNSSGASLSPANAQAVYTGGASTGGTDIVQAWDLDNALGRAVFNVFDELAAAEAGQAIIIAGRTSAGDTLWPATDYLADTAYTTLRYRGFARENLHYLSPEPDQDVDGNGLLDDIDGESTFAEAAGVFTNTVAGADKLFVYLVDHGGNSSGNGYFRLNAFETLTAAQLDAWLDALQDASGTEVVVLLDFCYAGSLIKDLGYSGSATRIVIAACGDDEPSYFVAGGLVSFSGAFFSGLMLGYDVSNCYSMASSAMSGYQGAQLDDDRDGDADVDDGAIADGYWIGPTYVAAGDAPVIGEACGNQVLTEETSATLWISGISSVHPVARAWCLVIPPGHDPDPENPVTDLPTLELAYDATEGRYSITHDGFTAAGTYNVTFYVQDAEGNVSLPRQAYVTQIGYDDRVILVAGGDTNGAAWPAIESLERLACSTFRLRLFTPDRMRVLTPSGFLDYNGDGTNDATAAATSDALQSAILDWALTNTTDRLTLYLLGEGADNTFRINDAESVATNQLAGWIQAFQAANPVPVTLVMDFAGAGAFLPALADGADTERIAIASTRAYQEALFANNGTVSFTQYLLTGVITGETLGDAYTAARRAIRRVSGGVRQRAQIDDNGNGIPSEKNTDGLLAAATWIGSAFVTGADAPLIGCVVPPQVLETPGGAVTLWASGVTGMYPISNVWCTVTAPDASPTNDLPAIALSWNPANARYEAVANSFTEPGCYVLTFYALDTAGAVSAPLQSEVLLADAFEPDDAADQASLYDGTAQSHTFHTTNDVDWVRVFLASNFVYEIETDHISERLDTVIDFYREEADGSLVYLDEVSVDEEGDDCGEYTGIDFPASGWYWARLCAYPGGTNLIGAYTFSIEMPAAATCSLIVMGVDDVFNCALPAGAGVSLYEQATGQWKPFKYFSGSKNVSFTGLVGGWYFIDVPEPTHHICREDPDTPGQVENTGNQYYGNPRWTYIASGWGMAGFEFLSTVTVASGTVRDAWTGAFIDNARLTFTATSGNLSGSVVDGHVMLTSYSTDWLTTSAGLLPESVVLGACSWNLALARAGYATNTLAAAITNPPAGSGIALGTLYLTPADANSNGIQDTYESTYFPGGCDPEADSDGDGLSNRAEYLCGTVPTNRASVLSILDVQMNAGGLSLTWSAAAGRGYRVISFGTPGGTGSVATNGPWEAAYGETTKTWIAPFNPLQPSRFFRVLLSQP